MTPSSSLGIIGLLVATPVSEGGFDEVDPNINDSNFPTAAEPGLEGAQLDEIVGSSEHVLAVLKSRGRRASNGAETLLYGQENPGEQEKYWIWGLGQVWVDPGGRFERVVVLDVGGHGERRAGIGDVVDVVGVCERVLSFPMTAEELAKRDAKDAVGRTD